MTLHSKCSRTDVQLSCLSTYLGIRMNVVGPNVTPMREKLSLCLEAVHVLLTHGFAVTSISHVGLERNIF